MDDGKRWYCAGSCVGVFFFFRRGGSLREGSGQVDSGQRLVDDGKRLDALDVVYRKCYVLKREGVRGREGQMF